MAARIRERDFLFGTITGIIAVAALVFGSEFGKIHGSALHPKVIAWASSGVLLVAGVISTRSLAAGFGRLATQRTYATAGAAVRLLLTGVGFVIVVFAVFAVLGVSVTHLVIGAGLIGIVLGIAAQQSLGNIFAALVLLFARPFAVGDQIQIRSGVIGHVDVQVLGLGLTYVTLRTEEGELKVPNSTMLAAGIGHRSTTGERPPAPDAGDPSS